MLIFYYMQLYLHQHNLYKPKNKINKLPTIKIISHNFTLLLQMMSQEEKLSFQLDKSDVLDRVADLVHTRLVDCGWRDQVRLACRKAIQENDDKNLTVDDLINRVTGNARSMVPDSVKRELLHELESVLVNIDKASIEYEILRSKK